MKLAVQAGDVVAIPGPGEPRLAEVRATQRGRLAVAPWPSARVRDRAPVTVAAREVLAHYRRRARASAPDVGDLVLADIRGRRFHARGIARPERAELRLDPLSPHSNYFHARPRDMQTRWGANGSAMTRPEAGGPGNG